MSSKKNAEKDLSVSKGALFKPIKYTKAFFPNLFFFLIWLQLLKIYLIPILDFFSQIYARYKNMKFVTARSLNCSFMAKFGPMLVETPNSGAIINPKTYLNPELGSN